MFKANLINLCKNKLLKIMKMAYLKKTSKNRALKYLRFINFLMIFKKIAKIKLISN